VIVYLLILIYLATLLFLVGPFEEHFLPMAPSIHPPHSVAHNLCCSLVIPLEMHDFVFGLS